MAPCQQFQEDEVCTTENCPHQHDLRLCRLCKIWCIGEESYALHIAGKRHRAAQTDGRAPPRLPLFCPDCGEFMKFVLSATDYDRHLASDRHRAAMGRDGRSLPTSPDAHCPVCSIDIFEADKAAHERSVEHKKKERFAVLQVAFDEAERDKFAVTVSSNTDLGFIDVPTTRGSAARARRDVQITYSSTDSHVYLVGARLTSSLNRRRAYTTSEASSLRPHTVFIDFESTFLGRHEDRLELTFHDYSLHKRFAITRDIIAVIGSHEDYEAIKPIAPYVPKVRKSVATASLEIEEGPKPPALAEVKWVVKLSEYKIPKLLEQVIASTTRSQELVRRIRATFLPRDLDAETYSRFFRTLLHAEEAQLKVDIETFDMENVAFAPMVPPNPGMLPVPGLAEKRPSLIVGDRILVQNVGSRSTHWWEGHVFHVRQMEVDLKFNGRFNAFVARRSTAFSQQRVLFPTVDHFQGCKLPTAAQRTAFRPVLHKIAQNEHQLDAVTAILHQPAGSPPFIVFGPPGTGKTITVVEAMRQLTLARPTFRILACAPSNSAADLLAERLADTGLSTRELFRLNAPSRSAEKLPVILEKYSRINDAGTFCVPTVQELCAFRVVVTTCISASVPHGVGVPRGHFSHVFIDEAGQASEPEAMISIKTLADPRTNVVLAGDPKQLGPIVHSRAAQTLGLQLSFLDRLMARKAYQEDMRGISFVKLTQNFRSHPLILQYPNKQFYANELVPCGDEARTYSFTRSSILATPSVPIIFENIAGKDLREAQSPSFFNLEEASLVKRYVQELYEDQKLRLTDEQVGIITPYHAQVGKIRTLLKKLPKGNKIKVGSVEEFQGGERRVIIISTVRSSQEHVHYDLRHTLGFVANPRRFNVAITRAQALLIVIGDASVLSLDPLWRGFLNFIHKEGGWKGRQPDWDVGENVSLDGRPAYDRQRREQALSDMDALVERTKELVLDATKGDIDGEMEWDGVADKEWREAE
ncbi:P-loop containing nucleoside triphosphate hydrolase protein [Auriculariales sp. MPI-PUGE-AT-0066]|nr:P-loop containing nucleoside triphosphate hydrolase protein [Auriculariales sp. MPI-PUGE-AT-0066]